MNGWRAPMMLGDLKGGDGSSIESAGFKTPALPQGGIIPMPSVPIVTRGLNVQTADTMDAVDQIARGAYTGDVNDIVRQLGITMQEFQRAITSTMTAFPVRENLEAEAKVLVPMDTPVRNRLKRQKGAGVASQWRQATSLGGGYSVASTLSAEEAAGQTVLSMTSVTGFVAGDSVIIGSGADQELKVIAGGGVTVGPPATITITVALANTQPILSQVYVINRHPGSPQGLVRAFFPESGAPAEHTTVYAAKTATYKLLGTYGSVSGLAAAGGANFQNQLAV